MGPQYDGVLINWLQQTASGQDYLDIPTDGIPFFDQMMLNGCLVRGFIKIGGFADEQQKAVRFHLSREVKQRLGIAVGLLCPSCQQETVDRLTYVCSVCQLGFGDVEVDWESTISDEDAGNMPNSSPTETEATAPLPAEARFFRVGQKVRLTKTLAGVGFVRYSDIKVGAEATVVTRYGRWAFDFGLENPLIWAEDPNTGKQVCIEDFVEPLKPFKPTPVQLAAQAVVSLLNESGVTLPDEISLFERGTHIVGCVERAEKWVEAFNGDTAALREYHRRMEQLIEQLATKL